MCPAAAAAARLSLSTAVCRDGVLFCTGDAALPVARAAELLLPSRFDALSGDLLHQLLQLGAARGARDLCTCLAPLQPFEVFSQPRESAGGVGLVEFYA
jgi:hypothetical protein